jgi:4-amino-4-deoxy-L-arabinose transferase-like glycosyltransferase
MNENLLKKIFFGSSIVMLLSMLFVSTNFGITGDEVDMNEYGKAVFNYYTTFGKDTTVFNMPELHNRDGVAQYYGGLFDLIAAAVNKVSPLGEYHTRHMLNALVGFIAIFLTGIVAANLGGWRMGLIALWIIFLSPRFFGHSMNNPKDIPFATATIFTIWAIYKLLDTLPKVSWKHIVFVALGIAASINVRVGGLLMIGYLGLFMLVEAWYLEKGLGNIFSSKNLKSYLIIGVTCALTGYFGGSLLWPYALQNPVSNPFTALEVMGNFKVNIRQLFEGENVFSSELPSYYLPKYIGITTPLVFLAGVLLVVFYWLVKSEFNSRRVAFILFTAIFPVAYIIYTKANVYHEFRHVQFAYPSLVILAALGWESLIRFLKKPVTKYVVGGAIALLALLPAKFMVANHPYQYLYFNEIVGGVEGAFGNYVTDYWMQSMKEASEWLIKNAQPAEPGKKIIVGTTAPVHVRLYLKGYEDKFDVQYVRFPQRHEKEWDYALFYADYISPQQLKNKNMWPLDQTVFTAKTSDVPIGIVVKRPNNSDRLGIEALNTGKIAEAKPLLEKAAQQYPNSDIINTSMGMLYLNMGNFNEGVNYLVKAIQQNNDNAQAYFFLGYAYAIQGNRSNASIYFQRAAKLNPGYAQQAQEILNKMN